MTPCLLYATSVQFETCQEGPDIAFHHFRVRKLIALVGVVNPRVPGETRDRIHVVRHELAERWFIRLDSSSIVSHPALFEPEV